MIARAHFRRDLDDRHEAGPDVRDRRRTPRIERGSASGSSRAFPDHGLVGEEYGTEAGDASVRWYIDPIDGTHNFIRGVPLFGTLLARRARRRAPGRRSSPRRPSTSAGGPGGRAAPGRGTAARSRAAIRVSRVSALEDAQLALRLRPRHRRRRGHAPGFESPARRRRGATAASATSGATRWSPKGAAEAMVEVGLTSWDAAAPLVHHRGGGRPGDRLRRAASHRHRDVPRLQRAAARDHPRATRGAMREDPEMQESMASRPAASTPQERTAPPGRPRRHRRSTRAPDPVDRALEPADRRGPSPTTSRSAGPACS